MFLHRLVFSILLIASKVTISNDTTIIKPKKLLYKGGKIVLNKDIFYHILKGGGVEYLKFTKLKEGVKRGILPNSIINMEKYIRLLDNKRLWLNDFDYEKTGDSEPICLI
ncbi:unnamed protein product [marine sediment metagenome]|uniref:Uncharacterized protein n=1 Tax=marine sediment metagenome TaxID=412755 RepID=X1FK28_9ZZZZ